MGLDILYGIGTASSMNKYGIVTDIIYEIADDEWRYIAVLLIVCLWAFGLGLLIGWLMTL